MLVGGIIGSINGYIAKQVFIYNALEIVRSHLEVIITKIATERLGSIAAGFFGRGASFMLSRPVTCLLGDAVYNFVRSTTVVIINIIVSFFQTPPSHRFSLIKTSIVNTVSYLASVITTNFFCNYCMPVVKKILEFGIRQWVQLAVIRLPVAFISTSLAVIATPTLAFMISDVIGLLAGEVVYYLGNALL